MENWRIVGRLQPSAEIAAVVKADAYGLGADHVGPALAQAGARTFFVAAAGEGVALRTRLGAGVRIFVLNGPRGDDVGVLRAAGLTPVLNSLEQIALWRDSGAGAFAVHVDTGMNRLGVSAAHWGDALAALGDAKPALLMSHLACASDPFHPMNGKQRATFDAVAATLPGVPRSLAASAGAVLHEKGYGYDLVRPGIALYGSWAAENADCPAMTIAARAYAPILQVRDIAPGDSIGYGATFVADTPMRVATIGAGYADGVSRALSNKGFVAIDGVICPMLGRVSMDLIVINVTWAKSAGVGDVVELLGDDCDLDSLARAADTIPYEILSAFGASMRRVYR